MRKVEIDVDQFEAIMKLLIEAGYATEMARHFLEKLWPADD